MDFARNLAAEKAIIVHISNDPAGTINQLLSKGVTRRWFSDPLYGSVIEASIKLHMQGYPPDPLAIMAHSTNGVPPERWKELFAIWKAESPGELNSFIEPLQTAVLLRGFDEVMTDAQGYRAKHPLEVRHWLSILSNALHGITHQGTTYDARPSSHFKQELRHIVATTGIDNIDRSLKGGLWDSAFSIFGGLSNHGKSTLAYTLASKCVERGIRTVFVTTETLPSEVTVGVLRPLAGLSDREVREKDPRCAEYLPAMDRYLAVYDRRFADVPSLDRVLYWEQPQVVLYDYIKAPESQDTRIPEYRLVANLGEGLRNLGNDHRCHIIAFGQFAASTAEKFRRDHDLREVTLFGSAQLYHQADSVVIMMRHWILPDTEFCKQKKDRFPDCAMPGVNLLDWEFALAHNQRTHSFQ